MLHNFMQIHTVRKDKNMHDQPHQRKYSGEPNDSVILQVNVKSGRHHQTVENQAV